MLSESHESADATAKERAVSATTPGFIKGTSRSAQTGAHGRCMASPLLLLFGTVFIAKIILMTLFSSDYENTLFVPFIKHFSNAFDNPWNYFYAHSPKGDEFPYQPLMLYILSISCWPLQIFGWDNVYLRNFFFKLPTLVSDATIAWLLVRSFPNKSRQVFYFYFLSPIILYASFMHSQLDLIPTAFLLAGVYFLRKANWTPSFIASGLALATKTHVVAAFPLIAIYLYKNQKRFLSLAFLFISAAIYLLFAFPFFDSPGFQHLVLSNAKQDQVFQVYALIGNLKIYLPIMAILIAYGRFAMYPKINTDLLDAFLTIVFSVFVLLIVPAPGWYVWMSPFLSIFMIKYYAKNKHLLPPLLALYFCYILYFVFFHQSEYMDLIFINQPFTYKITSGHLPGIVFTLLEASLLANIILCYRAGVRSNSIYQRDRSVVIGIGGDSGAGKSTLLQDIKSLLNNNIVEVEGDADHKWARGDEQWNLHTHLDPKANFLHRQADTILELKHGKEVRRGDYDHITGQFTAPKLLQPKDFIVISGLHTFYLPKMRKIIDLKIFMDPDRRIQSYWKITRDIRERGHKPEQVTSQMRRRSTDVDRFVAPQKDFADIIVRYFGPEDFEPQNMQDPNEMYLAISLSSSLQLEDLVQALSAAQILIRWDYNQNLSKQEIVLSKPLPVEVLNNLAIELIPNLDELISQPIGWKDDYRGFVQLIVLMSLSDLKREQEVPGIV